MQLLKRNSSNTLKRHTSESHMANRVSSRIDIISPPGAHTPLYKQNFNQNIKSTMEIMFQNKNGFNLKKISARVQLRNRKQILGDTEEKIFSEVLGLTNEIDELKIKITSTHAQIRQLQITHPDVAEKVRFYGYDQKLTKQQCIQVEEENERLANIIRQAEESQVTGLEDVLRIERQKYEDLKRQLMENKLTDSKSIEERIWALKASINELQNERSRNIKANYPQFDDIKLQNEVLRQKTLTYLIHSKSQREEEEELLYYLRGDEENRQEFLRELQSWKNQYKRIKSQNEAFKLKLLRKERVESKENINGNLQRSKAASSKMLQLQSQIKKKGNDRLSEYSTLIKRMQSLNK